MNQIKLRGIVAAISGVLLMGALPAMADSTDDIINALMAKGVLTEEEGALLMKGRTGEKEAAEEKKQKEIKASYKDGITFESADKKNSLSVNGRVQLDYRAFDGGNTDQATADTFDVRRAYLGVKGKFMDYYEFAVITDFASKDDTGKSKSAQLDEAYFNINWWKQAQFKFGQFKMPMSLEEQTSSRFIDFQERSMMNGFVPGKEIGAMVHGEPMAGVYYGLALSTGEGKNNIDTSNKSDSNAVIGRASVNIAELIGHKDNVYHLAVSGAKDHNAGIKTDVSTEGKGMKFFAMPTLDATNSDRTRYGLEGALAIGPVKLQSEWLRANYQGHVAAGNYDNDIDIWYAEALWLITGEKYADSYKTGGKFDRIKPLNDFNPAGKGMGAWEVGVRYTKFDASDFAATGTSKLKLSGTTSTAEADAWTLGLKWIPMPNTRFLANYVRTDFDTPITCSSKKCDKEDAFTVRAQFDF